MRENTIEFNGETYEHVSDLNKLLVGLVNHQEKASQIIIDQENRIVELERMVAILDRRTDK